MSDAPTRILHLHQPGVRKCTLLTQGFRYYLNPLFQQAPAGLNKTARLVTPTPSTATPTCHPPSETPKGHTALPAKHGCGHRVPGPSDVSRAVGKGAAVQQGQQATGVGQDTLCGTSPVPKPALPVGEVAGPGGVSCTLGGTKTSRGGCRGQLPHTQRNPQLRKGLSCQIAPQPWLPGIQKRPSESHTGPGKERKTWLGDSGISADRGTCTPSRCGCLRQALCFPAPPWLSTHQINQLHTCNDT